MIDTYRYALVDDGGEKNKLSPNDVQTNPNYIGYEQIRLEQEQKELDLKAAKLEQQLRQEITFSSNSNKVNELLKKWFNLVNQKSALVRRSIQLSMM